MLSVLIVEDSSQRIDFFKSLFIACSTQYARSSGEAIEKLADGEFDLIFLDYDLADETTAVPVARYIREEKIAAKVVIHSDNPGGTGVLSSLLRDSLVVPVSRLRGNSDANFRLKALLARPDLTDAEEVLGVLRTLAP